MARKQTSEKSLVVSSGVAPARRNPATANRKKTSAPKTVTPSTPELEDEYNAEVSGETETVYEAVTQRDETSAPTVEAIDVEAPAAAPASYKPTPEEIAQVAYLYWEARGYQGGSAEEDWLRAERELSGQVTMSASATV